MAESGGGRRNPPDYHGQERDGRIGSVGWLRAGGEGRRRPSGNEEEVGWMDGHGGRDSSSCREEGGEEVAGGGGDVGPVAGLWCRPSSRDLCCTSCPRTRTRTTTIIAAATRPDQTAALIAGDVDEAAVAAAAAVVTNPCLAACNVVTAIRGLRVSRCGA